jgi:hypothetical protein
LSSKTLNIFKEPKLFSFIGFPLRDAKEHYWIIANERKNLEEKINEASKVIKIKLKEQKKRLLVFNNLLETSYSVSFVYKN